jgi:hypothetical protein
MNKKKKKKEKREEDEGEDDHACGVCEIHFLNASMTLPSFM